MEKKGAGQAAASLREVATNHQKKLAGRSRPLATKLRYGSARLGLLQIGYVKGTSAHCHLGIFVFEGCFKEGTQFGSGDKRIFTMGIPGVSTQGKAHG